LQVYISTTLLVEFTDKSMLVIPVIINRPDNEKCGVLFVFLLF